MNDEHRELGSLEHTARHAPEKSTGDRVSPVRSDGHEVGIELDGTTKNRINRISIEHLGHTRNAAAARSVFVSVEQLRLVRSPFPACSHVKDDQRRALRLGELERRRKRSKSRGRTVGCDDDRPHGELIAVAAMFLGRNDLHRAL